MYIHLQYEHRASMSTIFLSCLTKKTENTKSAKNRNKMKKEKKHQRLFFRRKYEGEISKGLMSKAIIV